MYLYHSCLQGIGMNYESPFCSGRTVFSYFQLFLYFEFCNMYDGGYYLCFLKIYCVQFLCCVALGLIFVSFLDRMNVSISFFMWFSHLCWPSIAVGTGYFTYMLSFNWESVWAFWWCCCISGVCGMLCFISSLLRLSIVPFMEEMQYSELLLLYSVLLYALCIYLYHSTIILLECLSQKFGHLFITIQFVCQ